uniref:Heme-binding protein 1 n=1 Tax=Anas platyrhynchos TaxID=8839 RepID=A0A8B9SVX3_ANAPL
SQPAVCQLSSARGGLNQFLPGPLPAGHVPARGRTGPAAGLHRAPSPALPRPGGSVWAPLYPHRSRAGVVPGTLWELKICCGCRCLRSARGGFQSVIGSQRFSPTPQSCPLCTTRARVSASQFHFWLREKDPSGAWSNLHSSLLGATALPPDLPFSRAGGFLLVTPCAHSVRGNTCCRPSLPAPCPASPLFLSLTSLPECEEAAYEERHYPAGKWACVTKGEPLYEQSISLSFMKLMRYICKENSVGRYLGMTVPVLNEIHLNEEGTELEREVLTAYYLPGQFQQNPPCPHGPRDPHH